jgi:zinc transporter, ZIP family
VLGFGAGALISAVSFELAEEGVEIGGAAPVGGGLAVGALTYFACAGALARRSGDSAAGAALALGAFLDGIPEQLVLGLGIALGGDVSAGLLGAIFVSNLPEAIGSASDMRIAGHPKRTILLLWTAVATLCALATVGGFLLQEVAGKELRGGINGFAAGALLVMLVGSMIPEASQKARDQAGLAAVLGFAVAAGLSLANQL